MLTKIRLALAATIAALIAALAAGGASAAAPAADCQPFAKTPCLLPFPSNLFTHPDRSRPTRLRVHLPAGAMPVNTAGQRVGVSEYDRADGFTPAAR